MAIKKGDGLAIKNTKRAIWARFLFVLFYFK